MEISNDFLISKNINKKTPIWNAIFSKIHFQEHMIKKKISLISLKFLHIIQHVNTTAGILFLLTVTSFLHCKTI